MEDRSSVDEEDAEGEELGVSVAVGAAVEDLDLVVHSFDRAGRDRTEVPRHNPVLGSGEEPLSNHVARWGQSVDIENQSELLSID